MRDFLAKWILDDNRQPVKVRGNTDEALIKWARWFENFQHRHVAFNTTRFFELSSVFLGIDHNFTDRGPPLLFETMLFKREREWKMIFGKAQLVREEAEDFENGSTQWRFATWDDTAANHMAILRRIERYEANAIEIARQHNIKVPEETAEERLARDAATIGEQFSALTGEDFHATVVRPPKPKS